MKKLKSIFFLLLATSMSFSLNGQEEPSWEQTLPRHDIQFGLGDPALLASGIGEFLLYKFDYSSSSHYGYDYYYGGEADSWFYRDVVNTLTFVTPTLNFEYRYRFAKWFWFGGLVSYADIYNQYKDRVTQEAVAHTNIHYISVMPSVRFSWLNKKYITLYSGLSLGCTVAVGNKYWSDIPNNGTLYEPFGGASLSGQLTAVGIQGGKNWYGFAEIGLGYQGFVKAGFGYKFNRTKTE